jgi:ankyrin repeat protein
MISSSQKNDTPTDICMLNVWSNEESNTTNAATTETLLDDASDALTSETDHANIIEYLLQTGSGDCDAALLCAVHDGRMNVVQYLLQKCKLSSHATNLEGGKTALYLAVEKYDPSVCGSLDIVKCLVNNSSGGKETTNSIILKPFHLAVKKGHLNIVQYMLEHSCVTVDGIKSALHLAVEDNNLEIVECLCLASKMGHLNIVQYLVENCHADINASNKEGKSALSLAVEENNLNIVEYLLGRDGTNVEIKLHINQETALKVASLKGKNLVQWLVEKGNTDVEASNIECLTYTYSSGIIVVKLECILRMHWEGKEFNI